MRAALIQFGIVIKRWEVLFIFFYLSSNFYITKRLHTVAGYSTFHLLKNCPQELGDL